MFPWLPLRGLEWVVWGTGRGPLPKGSCMQQGAVGGTLGDSGREEALSGLLLGRAGTGGGSTLWLQPLPFSCTQGHHIELVPEPQHPASLRSSLALMLVGAGR